MIEKDLRAAVSKRRIVTIFADKGNSSGVVSGYADATTKEHVRIKAIDRFGNKDGYKVRRLSDIHRVDWDSDYERILEFLSSRVQPEQQAIPDLPPVGPDEDLNSSTLLQAKDRELVVYVESHGIQLFGYVAGLTLEAVRLSAIDEAGRQNGHLVVRLDAIDVIDCNTLYERRLDILHKEFRGGRRLKLVEPKS